MNPGRTFQTRLINLMKIEKANPLALLPCLELLDEELVEFQADVMSDKQITAEEKGRIATSLTPLLRAIRNAKDVVKATKERQSGPDRPKLSNKHLE